MNGHLLAVAAAAGLAAVPAVLPARAAEAPAILAPPPQDQGLPYTRSGRQAALVKIKECAAVFAGSRYAYVKGYKVRLDDDHWRDEAVLKDGLVWVPACFASLLRLKDVKPDKAPAYLADRWVYTIPRGPFAWGGRALQVNGRMYVAATDVVAGSGLKVTQPRPGLLLVGPAEVSFGAGEQALLDSVVTLFDTPEKLADPEIATRYIPTLKRQGKWTDHVKATPEQFAVLNGPETQWPVTPKSEYDLRGFNKSLLGSKVPKPGVYPRVLFSPQDVPAIAARVKSQRTGQMALIEMGYLFRKSFWDPSTDDGRVFLKLASGDTAGLEWGEALGTPPSSIPQIFKGEKAGIMNSHVAYLPECLTAMALYCLLTGDDAHGRQAAAAIATYFKLREPLVEEWNAVSDSQFGSSYVRPDGSVAQMDGGGAETHWRNLHGAVAQMNLGLALDFAGKWMTPAEKDTMRRVIARATYGRRAYGQDGPARFRDVNWVTWDLPQFLALAAIEGLEGFDREAYESNAETVRAFCEWGIDDHGVVYESNGKSPGGFQFQLLTMIALARRGENLFGHPHWRKLLQGQVQMTSPTGRVIVNSGTQYTPFSGSLLSFQFADEMKAFFPGDRCADYILSQGSRFSPDDEYYRGWQIGGFDPAAYGQKVTTLKRLRLPSPTYPGFVKGVLYDADFQPTTRADLKLPLDFDAPVHGIFSSYSDRSPEATWICMMVRPDHYLGAGHHHADAGMLHFSALGVDWFTESAFSQSYDGKYHNQVLVDGKSEPENMPGVANGYQAAAKYLGVSAGAGGAFGTADLTNSYTYRWLTQPAQTWSPETEAMGWEMDPSPENLRIWAGTARYKMRPWWPTYTFENFIPTCRAPWNPMQYVFRTAGLVRGPHPYAVVADDLKKDRQPHLYQWTMMLNGGVWQAEHAGLAANQIVLGFQRPDPRAKVEPGRSRPALQPKPGDPLLLVCALGMGESGEAGRPLVQVESAEGPADRNGKSQYYDRLVINRRDGAVRYRVLLIPFRAGEALPQVEYDAGSGVARVGQDEIALAAGADGRTRVRVVRQGKEVAASR